MNRYSSYKDSGVEWIGEIPKHWLNGRVKNLIDNSKYYQIGDGDHGSIKPEMYQDEGIPYIRVQNLNWNGQIDKKGLVFISNEVHSKNQKSKLILNDILIAKTGATVGKLGIIDEQIGESNTTSSVGKITINQNKHSAHFFLYFFQCDFFQKLIWLKSEGKSAQPSFNIIDLIDFPVLILPLHEQEQIVAYLDKKTAIVDTLIASKEEKINLLKENRTALINQVITKGLDPSVKMKDSGVEWIGEIPEHWDCKSLKYVSKVTRGAILRPVDEPSYFDENGEWSYLNIADATICGKYLSKSKLRLSDLGSTKSARVEPNNLIITASATIGKPFINTIPVCVHDGFIPITELKINIDFLFFYFKNPQLFNGLGKSNSQKNIYLDDVKNLLIPIPPSIEQQQIVEYLDTHTKEIDELIALEQEKIETLKEYRQALISEVVTGKINVVK